MAFEQLEKEKQNKIINAACEIFAKHGYKKGSMNDIAETAEVSKSVLFKYFSTKQNLYLKVFRLSSDSIRSADEMARLEGEEASDVFSLMRRSAKTRLSLFKKYPWIYKFAYAAAFDSDSFVRELVKKEYEDYQKTRKDITGAADGVDGFNGFRKDITPETARQIIFWVSQGYLEDKLYKEEIDPDQLEQGFEKWIDILETLLKEKQKF